MVSKWCAGGAVPLMIAYFILSVSTSQVETTNLDNYEEMTNFQIVRSFARQHPQAVHQVLLKLTGMMKIKNREEANDLRREVIEALADPKDAQGCTTCKVSKILDTRERFSRR